MGGQCILAVQMTAGKTHGDLVIPCRSIWSHRLHSMDVYREVCLVDPEIRFPILWKDVFAKPQDTHIPSR